MDNWKRTLISSEASILQAIDIIDKGELQIALVIDNDSRLVGTVTDGDVRRGILKGIKLTDSVQEIMNNSPVTVSSDKGREYILEIMNRTRCRQIPVLNEWQQVIKLEVFDTLLRKPTYDNWVILMAGGLGTRLRPLTYNCPKPLLKVGEKPILETILESFIEYGFHRFCFSVNYMSEMIKEYFGDGSRWNVEICYIDEKKKLGTAGALSLLQEKPDTPFFVMNGDLLTKVNFVQLLNFHQEHQSKATMCIREYNYQIPYGVVSIDRHRLISIEEKPLKQFFVSAGIYVLEPEVLDYIPKNTFFDMPELFQKVIDDNQETSVFPIREYWLDIGRIGDYEKANGEYNANFSI